ncbi:Pentatricopeptide repeat-containing protein [Carex littledalei]|uniref:Pentatricopeptide repeat-containing protein n=1 Tax=Carex littledalei TaxID=544730 RepID=A0A833RK14_9POAL|nr:Pentatricopeptide repeat-containing protein [Carex littledalei]
MKRVGIKPDVVVYSVLIDGHFNKVFETCWSEIARERRNFEIWVKSEKLIERMLEDGIEPDVACYTVVIYGMCKMEHSHRAQELFDKLLENGLKPHVPVYTALINGYCRRGKIE